MGGTAGCCLQVMYTHEAQLVDLYKKIDADGDGEVSWDEFVSFMIYMQALAIANSSKAEG